MILETPLTTCWHRLNISFDLPKVVLRLLITSPAVYVSPEAAVQGRLLVDIMTDQLNEIAYDAQLAGATYVISMATLQLSSLLLFCGRSAGLLLWCRCHMLVSVNAVQCASLLHFLHVLQKGKKVCECSLHSGSIRLCIFCIRSTSHANSGRCVAATTAIFNSFVQVCTQMYRMAQTASCCNSAGKGRAKKCALKRGEQHRPC